MATNKEKILAVDDEAAMREIIRRGLQPRGYQVHIAANVPEARKVMAADGPFDLIICDINMPGENGTILLQEVARLAPRTVMVMATAVQEIQVAIKALKLGAYDYLLKPFDMEALAMTVARALERRSMELEIRAYRESLEKLVEERTRQLHARNTELVQTQRAMLRALCHMAEFRDPETGRHLERMAHYSRIIARTLGVSGPYRAEIDDVFVANIFEAGPMHDLGKIGIPDGILLKPGKHTPEEREIMQKHSKIGRDALLRVKAELPESADMRFIDMAVEVAAYHHEKFDGTGYPFRLAGANIPLSARIISVADYYDACTSPRVYRPEPIPHERVKEMMLAERGKHFDPVVLDAFLSAEDEVNRTREELAD
ncbi:MAG: HD domain-containing phosphohydrolase [Myxococcota bacterium]